MTAIRVIPCLDVDAGRVVKGINFKDLQDSGDPLELAKKYFEDGADEITFLDISATIEGRSTMQEVVTSCAEAIFIPLTVGGGVRDVDDVSRLLAAGADKVSVGSAAVERPNLIAEIAEEHGSQVLVLSLDIQRGDSYSGFIVTKRGGRERTEIDALEWVRQVSDSGAGELLINSIDADGTKDGFDVELLSHVRKLSSLPLIASGGAGELSHFVEAANCGVDALLAASVFHQGELAISEVKKALSSNGFEVRN